MRYLKTWLTDHWVAAAGFMAIAILTILPLMYAAYPLSLVLIFLHSPAYMLHQVEEHTGDRFRTFVNQRIFAGRNALSALAVLVINIPVVWGLNLAALYAAYFWSDGHGLVAKRFMRRALARHGRPDRIGTDGSQTNREAIISGNSSTQSLTEIHPAVGSPTSQSIFATQPLIGARSFPA